MDSLCYFIEKYLCVVTIAVTIIIITNIDLTRSLVPEFIK
jgi:hypothetical protein